MRKGGQVGRFTDRAEARSKMFDYIEVSTKSGYTPVWLPITCSVRVDRSSIQINLSEKSGVLQSDPVSGNVYSDPCIQGEK